MSNFVAVHNRWLSVATALLLAVACQRPAPSPPPEKPAHVSNAPKESDLATVTLTTKAAERLGIRTGVVERRSIARVRSYGGDVVVPRGQSNLVSAPVAGVVLTLAAGVGAGQTVKRGQIILRLRPLPTPAELSASGIRLEAARKRADRAQKLFEAGAGSQRSVEEARAEFDVIQSSAAPGRGDGASGALALAAPREGVIRDLFVGSGQAVAAGAPLFQIDAASVVWVRVPIYVGDLTAIDTMQPAKVLPTGRDAEPVAAPPSADPVAATSDLFYQLDNVDGAFRPGQRVEVNLKLIGGEEEQTVAPWAAVIHDVYGGTWVYEARGALRFSRRRLEVVRVVGPWAILGRGPAAGTKVVTDGAAELYGSEFGNGK